MARRLVLALAVLLGMTSLAPAVAAAHPHPVAKVDKVKKLGPLRTDIWVDSPAMKQRVKLSVLTPAAASGPRPTVYMLDGAGATGGVSDWITKGHAGRFFAGRNVNVVLPTGGEGTFYTDWLKKDPKVGKPMWDTFLSAELPKLIDQRFNGNGRNAVIGLSMGGQAAFALTIRHPNLYSGLASLSGCPTVTGPVGEGYVRTTVGRTGADATNMWGPIGTQDWKAHDPLLHSDQLRGKNIFLSAGSGAIGPLDLIRKPEPGDDGPPAAVTASSSALELGAYRCSQQFAGALRSKGINYTDGFRFIGTHYWAYWEQDLPGAWATVSRGLY